MTAFGSLADHYCGDRKISLEDYLIMQAAPVLEKGEEYVEPKLHRIMNVKPLFFFRGKEKGITKLAFPHTHTVRTCKQL